jgi:hypothetical protein
MHRVAVLGAATAALSLSALAQDLPNIDIKAHCADVGGGDERVAACIDNENEARLWLVARRIEPRLLYICTRSLSPDTLGYVMLRGCVLTHRRQQ